MALFDNVRMVKRPNASPRRAGVSRSAAAEVERAVVLRRCAEWRKAFSGAEVAYPADALSYPPAAQWIRQRGLCVEACSAKGLALTLSGGIRPARVVFRCAGEASLDLVGVHSTIDGAIDACDAVERAIEQMSYLRHHDGVITTRLYLAVVDRPSEWALHSLARAIDDAVDEACARYRFPRPEPIVAPDVPTLTGARVA